MAERDLGVRPAVDVRLLRRWRGLERPLGRQAGRARRFPSPGTLLSVNWIFGTLVFGTLESFGVVQDMLWHLIATRAKECYGFDIRMKRIIQNPRVLAGKPNIAGTRMTVEFILELLASGMTVQEIAKEYRLDRRDIASAIEFAVQEMKRENVIRRSFAKV